MPYYIISTDLGTQGDRLYSQNYSPTQMVPPAYHPGYVQTEFIQKFPGASTQKSTYHPVYPSLDDSIARQAWLFTQPEFRCTKVFGPGSSIHLIVSQRLRRFMTRIFMRRICMRRMRTQILTGCRSPGGVGGSGSRRQGNYLVQICWRLCWLIT